MLDCQIAILENAIARYFSNGEIPKPMGSRHPSITPFEAYKTKDSFIIIAAGNDKLFENLLVLLVDDSHFQLPVLIAHQWPEHNDFEYR